MVLNIQRIDIYSVPAEENGVLSTRELWGNQEGEGPELSELGHSLCTAQQWGKHPQVFWVPTTECVLTMILTATPPGRTKLAPFPDEVMLQAQYPRLPQPPASGCVVSDWPVPQAEPAPPPAEITASMRKQKRRCRCGSVDWTLEKGTGTVSWSILGKPL